MKSFKDFTKEETLDSFASKEWKEGKPELKKQVQKILPEKEGYKVAVAVSELGGKESPSYFVSYWNINDAGNKIKQNSKAYSLFHMHTDAKKQIWKWELSTSHFMQKQAGIKFRALRSTKSMEDANKKLLAWIKKNKPTLDELMAKKNG